MKNSPLKNGRITMSLKSHKNASKQIVKLAFDHEKSWSLINNLKNLIKIIASCQKIF
jgi:hypothetical protein